MISCGGHDSVTSCASIRAGISRQAEVAHFSALDFETYEMQFLNGFPISSITDGFQATSRWLQMMNYSFKDWESKFISEPNKLTDEIDYSNLRLFFVIPSLNSGRYEFVENCDSENIAELLFRLFVNMVKKPFQFSKCQVIQDDQMGISLVLQQVEEEIKNDVTYKALVIAVDSLLDANSLNWLAERNRLKSSGVPAGLMPGESAVTLYIESSTNFSSPGFSIEKLIFDSQADGTNLFSNGLNTILSFAEKYDCLPSYWIGNLNGENIKAKIFANALVGVQAEYHYLDIHIPAVSIGDIGAAFTPLNIIYANHLLERKYVEEKSMLVFEIGENGRFSILLVTRKGS